MSLLIITSPFFRLKLYFFIPVLFVWATDCYAINNLPPSPCYGYQDNLNDIADKLSIGGYSKWICPRGDFCLKADHISDSGYLYPNSTDQYNKLEKITPKDLMGNWEGVLPTGVRFRTQFISENEFIYEEFDSQSLKLSGNYYMGFNDADKEAGILFVPKHIHNSRRKLLIFPANQQFLVKFSEYAFNRMRLPSLWIDVGQNGKDYYFEKTKKDVVWKRKNTPLVCRDLQNLRKKYQVGAADRIRDFRQNEIDWRNSISDLTSQLDSLQASNTNHNDKFDKLIEQVLLPARGKAGLPSFLITLIAIGAIQELRDLNNAEFDKIFSLTQNKKFTEEMDLHFEEKGFNACGQFLEDFQWLYLNLLCD